MKAPIDMSEHELEDLIRGFEHTTYFVADWLRELDRRQAKRIADHQTRVAYVATGAAAVSAIAALVALLVSRS